MEEDKVISEQEVQSTYDQDLRSSASDRLLEVYDQIADTEDIAQKTAALLTTTNFYGHAIKLSNILNGRQGKNRITVTGSTAKLMGYSLETDIDEVTDMQLTNLLVSIIDTYLADKQELPDNQPKVAAGILSRVKALMIMMISTNNYGIIHLIKIPRYMLKMLAEVFDQIRQIKDDVLNSWIKWLEENNNPEMAEIVKSVGNEFWGSEGVKANVLYDKYFYQLNVDGKIHEPVKTYNMYLEFRSEYRKSTKTILPSRLYDIFNITSNAYSRARQNVYYEMQQLFPEDENVKVIKKLLYE